MSRGIVKKLLKTKRNKKNKHNDESIRMMKTQRNDIKKGNLIEEAKKKALMKLLDKMHQYKKVLSYCLKCRKNTDNINPNISGTSNGKTMILSNCAICGSRNSRFIKKQEANGLVNILGIKTPLSEILVFDNVLF